MAVITKDIIRFRASDVGGTPSPRTYAEAASEVFKKGEIVFVNAAGFLAEITSDTPTSLLGVAGQDAHNKATSGDAEASVFLAHPTSIFEGNVLAAAAADYVLLASDIGNAMQIQRDTTNNRVHLNAAAPFGGANVRVWVHAVAPGSAVGDTNARVLFSFLPNFIQFLGTS